MDTVGTAAISTRLLETSSMKPVSLFELELPINMNEFSKVFTKDIRMLIEVLQKYHFDIRVVGGAVRDFLQGKKPRDVDFATNAEPAELIFIFDIEGIEYDADGIEHGTIKAVFGDNKIDVTSITYKLRKEGNNIKITRNQSWEVDSLSRDLTVNSMSIDLNGMLYDYQNAVQDVKTQLVKFCPNIQDKINQDPFYILRWIKGISQFDNPKWLRADRNIVAANAGKLVSIKDDKKTQLFLASLLSNPNKTAIFKLMCKLKLAQALNLTCNN